MLPFSLPGFEVQEVESIEEALTTTARALTATAICPTCGQESFRLHSYYTRCPADLPVSGQAIRLKLRVRRFRCQNQTCQQQTFVEPLPEAVSRYARQTKRLSATLQRFALPLSGPTGSRLLNQSGIAVSGRTLLRWAHSTPPGEVQTPEILGVDDFAFKRGRTYGAILVDLATHRSIDLLPERTADALSLWLRNHPSVLVISRDRSTEFARGASDGAPEAVQIADRSHILQNLREACERTLKRMHEDLIEQHKAAGFSPITRYKRRRSQTEIAAAKVACLRRQARYEEVVVLYQQGMSILSIAEELRMSRCTVRNSVYAGAFPERANVLRAKSLLDPYLPYLEKRLTEGCRNANQLWEEVKAQGVTGNFQSVSRWLAPRREKPGRKHSLRERDLLDLTETEEAGTYSQQPARIQERGAVEPVALEAPRHLDAIRSRRKWLLPHTIRSRDRRNIALPGTYRSPCG
jgi:transposase